MSQEKVNAYKEKKQGRKSDNQSAAKKAKLAKNFRTVVFYAIIAVVVGGVVWVIINMVDSYKESIPNYDPTNIVIDDYVDATSTAEDLTESLVDEGAITVDDSGESSATEGETTVAAEGDTASETTAQ